MLIVLRHVGQGREGTIVLCIVRPRWSTGRQVLLVLMYCLPINLVDVESFLVALLLLLSLIKATAHYLQLGLRACSARTHHRMLL